MCGIFAIWRSEKTGADVAPVILANHARGRDAWGLDINGTVHRDQGSYLNSGFGLREKFFFGRGYLLGNMRAMPTTEWVKESVVHRDIQPYRVGDWSIVHNGTIANDKQLVERHGFNPATAIDSWVIAALLDHHSEQGKPPRAAFEAAVRELVGSYAIAAVHASEHGRIFYACNYRPLYLHLDHETQTMAISSVPVTIYDTQLPPYSIGHIGSDGVVRDPLLPPVERHKALVVFSGGLDSTVAAARLLHDGVETELLHFGYGCRASGPERKAVHDVAEVLGCELHIVDTPIFTEAIGGSRLTNTKREAFADGEAGAEYAHEWVPARNLILTSIAVGFAESHGHTLLALGANLEEAGAYPDNEPEFIRQFGRLLPFAVADSKQLNFATPVGNLMKHEIVALGLELGAPLHLTWSCYNDGPKHCGNCGPCFMRKTAFEINGAVDPVFERN